LKSLQFRSFQGPLHSVEDKIDPLRAQEQPIGSISSPRRDPSILLLLANRLVSLEGAARLGRVWGTSLYAKKAAAKISAAAFCYPKLNLRHS
jgi:hypothetical protein